MSDETSCELHPDTWHGRRSRLAVALAALRLAFHRMIRRFLRSTSCCACAFACVLRLHLCQRQRPHLRLSVRLRLRLRLRQRLHLRLSVRLRLIVLLALASVSASASASASSCACVCVSVSVCICLSLYSAHAEDDCTRAPLSYAFGVECAEMRAAQEFFLHRIVTTYITQTTRAALLVIAH